MRQHWGLDTKLCSPEKEAHQSFQLYRHSGLFSAAPSWILNQFPKQVRCFGHLNLKFWDFNSQSQALLPAFTATRRLSSLIDFGGSESFWEFGCQLKSFSRSEMRVVCTSALWGCRLKLSLARFLTPEEPCCGFDCFLNCLVAGWTWRPGVSCARRDKPKCFHRGRLHLGSKSLGFVSIDHRTQVHIYSSARTFSQERPHLLSLWIEWEQGCLGGRRILRFDVSDY